MNRTAKPVTALISSSLILGLLALNACEKQGLVTEAAASDAAVVPAVPVAPVAQPAVYTPPTADQLYQMVAPIALFPDQLVAQVLAGATYPEQVEAAGQWLTQNPSLQGEALAAAVNPQPWDPSIKGLTVFPAVLAQMAQNPSWTRSLGDAYVNDPNDVMNAIQVMRGRAQVSGNLKTSPLIRVTQLTRAAPPSAYSPAPDAPPVYAGLPVIAVPAQTILIEPAQPDIVYVPSYNPVVVYGEPVAVFPGYLWHPPVHSNGAVVASGAVSFGIGIAVGAAVFGHYGWGWHAWGVIWGGAGHAGAGPGGRAQWQRSAVVYNHTTYVSKSTTVINHIVNTRITDNRAGMTVPRFTANDDRAVAALPRTDPARQAPEVLRESRAVPRPDARGNPTVEAARQQAVRERNAREQNAREQQEAHDQRAEGRRAEAAARASREETRPRSELARPHHVSHEAPREPHASRSGGHEQRRG